jgi:hypothetical protein
MNCAGWVLFSIFLIRGWQPEYKAALLELDPKKLLERVQAAEAAVFNRLQELAHSDNPDHKAERQTIQDALANLRVL